MRESVAERMGKLPGSPCGFPSCTFKPIVVSESITAKDVKVHEGTRQNYRSFPESGDLPELDEPTELGEDSEIAVFSAAENREGCGRYPLRVRTL